MENELHFGIMCSGNYLSKWEADCIHHLLKDKRIRLKLILLDSAENYTQQGNWNKIVHFKFKHFFFILYDRFLLRPFSKKKVDVSAFFAGIPQLVCNVTYKGKYSQYFKEEDVNDVRKHELDFILRFGFNIIRGEILQAAKYGVWSFHHDDEMKYRGGPPCFWEIYHREAETGSILQRLTDQLDGGIVLKKGIFRTKSHSYKDNINQAYMESAKWPYWVCKDLLNGNLTYIDKPATATTAPIFKYPSNGQFLIFIGLLWFNRLKKIYSRLFLMQKWNVAVVNTDFDSFISEKKALGQYALLFKNAYTFNADGFAIKKDNKMFLFFEELDYKSPQKKGRIKAFDYDAKQSQYIFPEDNIHRSYPFIFQEGNDVYMIPEEGETKMISLYKAESFPYQWKRVCALMEGDFFIDPSLIKFNNKYWLFYTKNSEQFDGDTHLHLAYSDKLSGPYTEHKGNPVKISTRSSRPAGAPFITSNNDLIRPAQNSSRTYGGSIVLNKVLTISEELFEEVEVNELHSPDDHYKDGMHTINIIDKQTVLIDMKKNLFRFDWFLKNG